MHYLTSVAFPPAKGERADALEGADVDTDRDGYVEVPRVLGGRKIHVLRFRWSHPELLLQRVNARVLPAH